MDELKIGVVGYSGQKFNEIDAIRMLKEAYDTLDNQYSGISKVVVSGLTDLGIPALAYREAVARNWKTVGVACSKAVEYPCFPVDKSILIGSNWGDESPTFLDSIDVLVRVGGGKQSLRETASFKETGKQILEYDLAPIYL